MVLLQAIPLALLFMEVCVWMQSTAAVGLYQGVTSILNEKCLLLLLVQDTCFGCYSIFTDKACRKGDDKVQQPSICTAKGVVTLL